MSRFQFRLESVLNIREKFEDKKKQEYSDALNKLQREVELKEKLVNESISLFSLLRTKMLDSISPREIIFYNNYANYLKVRIAEQEDNIMLAKKRAEEKRQELIEASKQKKMLEKLKEKEWINFLDEENKKEQKIIDEIVSFKSQNRLIDRSETNSQ